MVTSKTAEKNAEFFQHRLTTIGIISKSLLHITFSSMFRFCYAAPDISLQKIIIAEDGEGC
jgi:hypothetical protein